MKTFVSCVLAGTSYISFRRGDVDVRFFLLDQHAQLNFYRVTSLRQQTAGEHVPPFEDISPIPNQPVFVRTLSYCLRSYAAAI